MAGTRHMTVNRHYCVRATYDNGVLCETLWMEEWRAIDMYHRIIGECVVYQGVPPTFAPADGYVTEVAIIDGNTNQGHGTYSIGQCWNSGPN